MLPSGYIIVNESGIRSNDDCKSLKEVGISAFLIGEFLMREEDIEDANYRIISYN
ncbi:hypothetical protein B488_03040 [Liberibacter crescens BT-1]|uniref:indole-3-glycerol-phosphate synthase n=1 Tax=Liberibacter crescens (strain BT-1) TaxID=1215343 RepID=L0ETL0_LIBCB|nr:hypothetical protein [Liberibacter crescens]AGA64297.1 hypothetical protein B488_03040 [Liberibacter crescens BT-1]